MLKELPRTGEGKCLHVELLTPPVRYKFWWAHSSGKLFQHNTFEWTERRIENCDHHH